MTENLLVNKIKELNQIKPSQDWVLCVKNRIFAETGRIEVKPQSQSIFRILFQPRVALIGTFSLLFVFGLFSFAGNSLPGDILYSLKRATEKSQVVLVPEGKLPEVQLEFANKRLEELTKIAKDNRVRRIAPALQEYHSSVAEVAKNLVKAAATTSDPEIIKGIAEQTQKFEKNKEILKNIYGIAGLEIDDSANPTKLVAEWLIKDLEKRTLSEDQTKLFAELKEDYLAGDYVTSLEKVLKLSEMTYPQESY